MKKNSIIAAFSAAFVLLISASCTKDNQVQSLKSGSFSAVIKQDITRTTLTDAFKVNWENGDLVSINNAIYSATPDSPATVATLTKVSGDDPTSPYAAIFPSSLGNSTDGYAFPSELSYNAGKFDAPMYAQGSSDALSFKNICGVFCFALKGTDKVKSINITANEAICGEFTMTDAETVALSGTGKSVTLDCGDGVQLNNTDATNFYVYIPAKDSYSAGMKIVITNTDGNVYEKTTTKAVAIVRSTVYTFNWDVTFLPGGALPGVFSVSDTTKVHFSQGYLYYDGTKFEFEANQYDRPSSWNASHVGHFFWSMSASVACAATYSDASTSATDVIFTNDTNTTPNKDFTVAGTTGKWRTLSESEWNYLFYTRTVNGGKGNGKAFSVNITYGGNLGIVLYPDDYTGSLVSGTVTTLPTGVVFLAAAGNRTGTTYNQVGSRGPLWCSDVKNTTAAKRIRFNPSSADVSTSGNTGNRSDGYALRLVVD